MKGYLIVNGFLDNHRFTVLYEMLLSAFEKENISIKLISNKDIYQKIALKNDLECDFIIFWDKDILLAKLLENQGYRLYNSSETIRICDDKGLTFISLLNNSLYEEISIPKTILAPFTFENIEYNDYSFIDNVIEDLKYPFIIKENKGSFGTGVYLINNKDDLNEIINKTKTKSILFQEYVKESKGRDIRVMTVGGKALGAVLKKNENDFRSNVLTGGKMYKLDKTIFPRLDEYLQKAEIISSILHLDFGSVDFLIGKDDVPILCEVNSNAHFKTFFTVTGINLASNLAKYIKNCQ